MINYALAQRRESRARMASSGLNDSNTGKNVSDDKNRLLKLATYASVATASLLIIAKLIAWFMTGSMSLLATLLDSTMDILASLITLFAVRIAIAPADEDHHFGHGKAEQLAVLAQSAFIGGSAIVLVLNTLDRITGEDVMLENESAGIMVMAFSIIATLILLSIQRYVIRKTNSAAIKSDSLHYQVDLLTNIAVLAALIGTSYGYHQVDNVLALLIGGYMLFSVRSLAWESIEQLMDKALPEEELQEIEQRALSVDGVLGIHDVKTRMSGSTPFIQMHLDLEPHTPLIYAHDLGVQAKRAVLDYLPEADVIVHLDPDGHDH
ncbi:cation diffusion facilitator family transporter [Endozoicomonas sp. GU-1]|uniref:cation diffusion facilitator family transporter n=1 Tax=Endozoicomonas sp. GU-1 TaxID=3009078 RepID=UPI0022B2DBB0|nr:cation diffusion facilitator family transporter [Endozoicomonas sp. GU-1]WBA79436.1 cation diffusion facilitator family transporter [Endozoicomonas sp. GU-1]WBA87080.1 cation diffusion facilitator family transporter [Endozoicomonas sp. GU-1]